MPRRGVLLDSCSILVVDDFPPFVDTLVEVLDAKGYEVETAYSGAQALQILQNHPVDLLLADIRMANMNGLELYRRARKLHAHLTTILMTAYAANDLIQQCLAEGVKAILEKPLDIDSLIGLISGIQIINSNA
jgi:CheY-like chemotaxis protein